MTRVKLALTVQMKRFLLMSLVVALVGCTQFHPALIDPADRVRQFSHRSLGDENLRAYLQTHIGHDLSEWPPRNWEFPMLVLVGLYYHPDLDVARSLVSRADARIVTAGTLPNPVFAFAFRYNTDAPRQSGNNLARAVRRGVRDGALGGLDDATGGALGLADTFGSKAPPESETPWTFIYGVSIPIEWPWKRKLRITEAEKLAAAARLHLMETAWRTRSGIRAALVEHLLAVRQHGVRIEENAIRARYLSLLEERLRLGDIVLPDVETARIDHQRSQLELASALSRVEETLASMAYQMGLSIEALRGQTLVLADLETPPASDLIARLIQEEALLNRFEVRRALLDYAAAELSLELEVAKQFPDLEIGPGYRWNQGDGVWTLGFSVPLPVFDRNQGPIAEAQARRTESAARFLVLQTQVIAEAESAHARLSGAYAEYALARELVEANNHRASAIGEAMRLGEADATTAAAADLQTVLARRALLDALGKVQAAIGQIEDATQRPFGGLLPPPETLETPTSSDVAKE